MLIIEQVRDWAGRTKQPWQYRADDGVLSVTLPADAVQAELSAFDPPDDDIVLFTLGDPASGWGMILQIVPRDRVERLFAIVEEAPKPITLAQFRALREAVFAEFPDTVDRTEDD